MRDIYENGKVVLAHPTCLSLEAGCFAPKLCRIAVFRTHLVCSSSPDLVIPYARNMLWNHKGGQYLSYIPGSIQEGLACQLLYTELRTAWLSAAFVSREHQHAKENLGVMYSADL